jgi:hypothetical protein
MFNNNLERVRAPALSDIFPMFLELLILDIWGSVRAIRRKPDIDI